MFAVPFSKAGKDAFMLELIRRVFFLIILLVFGRLTVFEGECLKSTWQKARLEERE